MEEKSRGRSLQTDQLAIEVLPKIDHGSDSSEDMRGLLVAMLGRDNAWAPLLMTGALGGFTTFSAFSLDAVTLWTRGAQGLAVSYVAASVALSLAALALGLSLGTKLLFRLTKGLVPDFAVACKHPRLVRVSPDV